MIKKNIIIKDTKKSWNSSLNTPELDSIINKLNSYKTPILPKPIHIFECFKYFDLKDTKVVILGQDPYINDCEAMGLSFSVPKKCALPPSLKNIFKELGIDTKVGDLSKWVKNNQFLMLNTALTVLEGKSNSHKNLWMKYINQLINNISNMVPKVIFVLLGNNAQSKIKFIDEKKHVIIKGIHPSPLSAYRGFHGSGIFDILDDEYYRLFGREINWEL